MKINVTQKHIDNGKSGDGSYCPVALAIKEQTNLNCFVGRYAINVNNKIIKYPKGVLGFICDFDYKFKTKNPQPFSFELEL